MKVHDLMTADVIAVGPDTSLKEVAELFVRHRISGVPVTDDDRQVLGVVSESEIVRAETGDGPARRPLAALLLGSQARRFDARTAGGAMTTPPVTVTAVRDVADAARLMQERRINRLPVVDEGGRLVGIVTRADLVRAFVRSDEEIERELLEEVVRDTLWIDPNPIWVEVEEGRVRLAGEVDTKADAQMLERFAARVPGVVGVHSTLRWRVDQPSLPRSDPRVPVAPRTRGR